MVRPARSVGKRLFRVATLLVPSLAAWTIAFSVAHRGDHLAGTVTLVLCPLWAFFFVGVLVRAVGALVKRRPEDPAVLEQLDVLTTPGSAFAWLAASITVLAVLVGWPSLAVVGLLGTGLFHAVVLRALHAFRGARLLPDLRVTRRFVPAQVVEGDDVNEELTFDEARIPFGFRLLAAGRIGPRFRATRYVLEGVDAGAEVVFESEVGPAVRGEHDAEPLEVWLQDTFGICRSLTARVGAARLTVLPRERLVAKTPALLDLGDGPRAPRNAHRLPTEGNLLLREYQQGDDVRRIHWVRSLAAGEIVVRLPDELPPDRPHVRLVLDTFFPEAADLACTTPAVALDALVTVWLAVARQLAESGVRVSLVAAVHRDGDDDGVVRVERRAFSLRAGSEAQRFGAAVAWQGTMTADRLVGGDHTYVVSRAVLYAGTPPPGARWIIVLPELIVDMPWTTSSAARFPFPMGTPDNRASVVKAADMRIASARRDHGRTVMALRADVAPPPAGSFLVRYQGTGPLVLEAVS